MQPGQCGVHESCIHATDKFRYTLLGRNGDRVPVTRQENLDNEPDEGPTDHVSCPDA